MIDYLARQQQLRLIHPTRFLSTFFAIGHFPFMPGTVASLAAVPAAWAILWFGGDWGHGALFAAATLVTLVGIFVSDRYERQTQIHDPKEVVIDEVAGQWYALVFAQPEHIWHFVAGFLLFRFFDITKFWPVNWAQRALPGGFGIMMDDVVAAVWSAAILYGMIVAMEDPEIAAYVRDIVNQGLREVRDLF